MTMPTRLPIAAFAFFDRGGDGKDSKEELYEENDAEDCGHDICGWTSAGWLDGHSGLYYIYIPLDLYWKCSISKVIDVR